MVEPLSNFTAGKQFRVSLENLSPSLPHPGHKIFFMTIRLQKRDEKNPGFHLQDEFGVGAYLALNLAISRKTYFLAVSTFGEVSTPRR